MGRSEALQKFLDGAFLAFDRFAVDIRSRKSLTQLFAQLNVPGVERTTPGSRLAVCERFLAPAMDLTPNEPTLQALISLFKALEPKLEWKWRATYDNTASQNFLMSHANVMIVGPGALEDRQDAWIGATLMAPNVRYPDHSHAPEETYLVISEGEFRQADGDWFALSAGGSFFNPPNIKHAMRSAQKPLFAFWALLPEQRVH
ncbi:transcriptional regulator [Mesorhizobium sp. M1C.F.Ca.ET.193.01.1.1]|uniref:dimethylsulfonioproprionate lyase family protein n=1 Tax=unclassified Mesorhizobium TaxID=325217 RepID=UPI000FD3AA42|nr:MULTISPECIES: dimethylsulfonioproprionate lyase family protein [unclassified Mesorhizobium]TGT02245.1 transcriptional regulator [bacterium M00.F.Ca.ET.177.01.1.1]TGQ54498.1 transcriptional regulator [Mesorhizobium sp. M1C.F.Ca.ET.210.01.1.1]TGQ72494.1 transcriptional regulator [Mesorhizobium sp. M1C.F.Ca.ET.212.01.1.1]TGR10290.1 transcriptional regulator [Mesorhizobium sp. M1C.F.Ca.ET.204.01.1.1]TGR30893.1 transcriptional regulator [Mesorhizobium sp. M1C.F.Ca.ET.196.01.1.1]